MKTTIALLAALVLSIVAQAQSPTPSLTPFDALGIYASAPSATPVPLTSVQIAAAQARFPNAVKFQLSSLRLQVTALYERNLAFFANDAILTGAQKMAALSQADQSEISTLSWALYSLLNYAPNTVDAKGNPIPVPNTPSLSGT